jgi:hypothetical protein
VQIDFKTAKQLLPEGVLAIRVTRLGEIRPFSNCHFGQVFGNCSSSTNFWPTFIRGKVMYEIWQKWVGLHFGRFIQKLIWDRCYDF